MVAARLHKQLASVLLGVLIPFSIGLIGCQRHSTDRSTDSEARLAEPYSATEGAVGFDILPVHGNEGSQAWLATYTDESGTTKYRIELDQAAPSSNEGLPISSGKGRFLAEAVSYTHLTLPTILRV